MPLREQLGHERDRRLTDLRNLDPQLTLSRLNVPGPEPVTHPRVIVTQPALALWPALIPSTTQPAIELLLDRPLNDQPRPEPGKLGQHLLRIIDHAPRQQLVDARLYLRRRRYGTSHGVGLLHRLAGLEGTYAVALTAPGTHLQHFWDATVSLEMLVAPVEQVWDDPDFGSRREPHRAWLLHASSVHDGLVAASSGLLRPGMVVRP